MIAVGSMALDNEPISCLLLLQNTLIISSAALLLLNCSSQPLHPLSSQLCIFSADEFSAATKRLFTLLSASGFFNATLIPDTHLCEPFSMPPVKVQQTFDFQTTKLAFVACVVMHFK